MKLTKRQKHEKRMRRYAEAVDRIDRRAYGGHERQGDWAEFYRGFPEGQKWTKDYGRRHGHG